MAGRRHADHTSGLNNTVSVPFGNYTTCIRTADTTPHEPDVLEHKTYCPGVGTVLEVNLEENSRIELIEVTAR